MCDVKLALADTCDESVVFSIDGQDSYIINYPNVALCNAIGITNSAETYESYVVRCSLMLPFPLISNGF